MNTHLPTLMENNTNIKKNYKKAPLSEVHIRVLIAVILGQIACGFGLGISGTALTNASKYIQISSLWTGLIGAGSLIGLAGSIVVGRLSDKIGRRKLLMIFIPFIYVYFLIWCHTIH